MEVSRIALALRPRNPWEAIDLGFLLARENLGPVYRAWVATAVPVALAVNLLLLDQLWLASLILWWLKPAFDRVVLAVLSRSVFGERSTLRETLAALPGLLLHSGLAAGLLWRRLSLARSFLLPVWQLEGLGGAARRARSRLIEKQARNPAVWLTVACIHIEAAVFLSVLGFLVLMLPDTLEVNIRELFFREQAPLWFAVLTNVLQFLSVTVVEPFYVAGGFALYLNRRSALEAWDVEIAFRRLAEEAPKRAQRRAA